MRGLRNLSLVLNRMGQFDEALAICNQLENECGDDLYAAHTSSDIFLNQGEWQQALAKAKHCKEIFKNMSFNAAFALLAMGDLENAQKYFLHAALNYPFTVHSLVDLKQKDLKKYEALTSEERQDFDLIVDLKANLFQYLAGYKKKIKNQFKDWLMSHEIQELIFERAQATKEWKSNRQAGASKGFKKMTEMGEFKFAEKVIEDSVKGKKQ